MITQSNEAAKSSSQVNHEVAWTSAYNKWTSFFTQLKKYHSWRISSAHKYQLMKTFLRLIDETFASHDRLIDNYESTIDDSHRIYFVIPAPTNNSQATTHILNTVASYLLANNYLSEKPRFKLIKPKDAILTQAANQWVYSIPALAKAKEFIVIYISNNFALKPLGEALIRSWNYYTFWNGQNWRYWVSIFLSLGAIGISIAAIAFKAYI